MEFNMRHTLYIIIIALAVLSLAYCSKNSTSSHQPDPSSRYAVSISQPKDSATVSEIVEVKISIEDGEADSVRFYINGDSPNGAIDKSAPFIYYWNVTEYQDSTFASIFAKAYLNSSRVYSDTIAVCIYNSSAIPNSVILENPVDITASSFTLIWNKSAANDFKSYKVFWSEDESVTTQSNLLKTFTNIEDTTLFIENQQDNSTKHFVLLPISQADFKRVL